MANVLPSNPDPRVVIRVAAQAGVDPKTARKYLRNPTPPNPKGGGLRTYAVVMTAARELGIALP